VQLASAGAPVASMAPVASLGDFQRRMAPVISPGDPGTPSAEPAARPAAPVAVAAAPRPRSFSLIPQAQAGTLPAPSRGGAAPVAAGGGNWGVQVGAFASANLARAAAGQARDMIAATGTRTAVEPVRQGSSTLYRARVVGLSSRGAADQACGRLRGRGACMIVAPGA
jgi:cell division protein FtsN